MGRPISIAVLDPSDPAAGATIAEAVQGYESHIFPCSCETTLLSVLQAGIDVVILGLQDNLEGTFALLSKIRMAAVKTEVILLGRFDDQALWLWMEAIHRGAYEFLPKPIDVVDLMRAIRSAAEKSHPVSFRKLPPAVSIKPSESPQQSKTMVAAQ